MHGAYVVLNDSSLVDMTKLVCFVDLIVTHLTPNYQLQENMNYTVYSFFFV